MSMDSYQQFCPMAMAAEVLCCRWTLLVVRELLLGSAHFNDLRRGVPRMSTALLAKRLKELEAAGIVVRKPAARQAHTHSHQTHSYQTHTYELTQAGQELRPIVEAMGVWGQRWVTTEATLRHLDANLLMWDMRRNVNPEPEPSARTTIEFIFDGSVAAACKYWLVVERGHEVDLCTVDPGFDVDLYVATDLRTLTEVWLGYLDWTQARRSGAIHVSGSVGRESELRAWLRLGSFAGVPKQVALAGSSQ
ncbi:MAG: helix-turn-helix transcriptional regulator [Proteobacteria bacterium]|nr:helix-turn-helix transcriptional regulator [Pseudomonadota bacterium]MBS0492481.1 helix-turn-helix transcriptional regulator [Pseudomonadota bacterium]